MPASARPPGACSSTPTAGMLSMATHDPTTADRPPGTPARMPAVITTRPKNNWNWLSRPPVSAESAVTSIRSQATWK